MPSPDDLRGHPFLPDDISDIPALGATEETSLAAKTIYLRFFTNAGSAYWLIAEIDPETLEAFGYAEIIPGGGEWGYISLTELRDLHVATSIIPVIVERDLHFTPRPFSEIER